MSRMLRRNRILHMNNEPSDPIRVRLGDELNKAFYDFVANHPVFRQNVAHMKVEQRTGQRPVSGFGLVVPPEILFAAGKGFAGAIGAGVGKMVWQWLTEFFSKKQIQKPTQGCSIAIGNQVFPIDPSNMSAAPPALVESGG